MPNGTKEAVKEGLALLGEALKVLKPTSREYKVIAKEVREITVLSNTKRIAEAELRLGPALEFASIAPEAGSLLRPPMAVAAEEMASRVPMSVPEAAKPKPLTVKLGWTRDVDSYGSLVVSQVRIWGIPVRRIVRAQRINFVARMRAVVPGEIESLIPHGKKIDLSLTGKKGVGFDYAATETKGIEAAERMTGMAVKSGKPPALRFKEGGMIGTLTPQGGKFSVDVRSAPGTPPTSPLRAIVDTYEGAVEFIRRVLFGKRVPTAAAPAAPPPDVPMRTAAHTPFEKAIATQILSRPGKIVIPSLSAAQEEGVHRVLAEAERIAIAEEAHLAPGRSYLVPIEFGGRAYRVSSFGLPASLAAVLVSLGVPESTLYQE